MVYWDGQTEDTATKSTPTIEGIKNASEILSRFLKDWGSLSDVELAKLVESKQFKSFCHRHFKEIPNALKEIQIAPE